MINKILPLIMVVLLSAFAAFSQTTEFTYQGSLTVSGSPANGNYDFEFALFDSLSAGAQLGSTLTRSTVAVANGTFSVKLDFGSQYPGADRFLEIRVRTAGGGAFTPLAPRQQVNSAPYSVKAVNADNAVYATNATTATNAATATNATQLGGVAASQYVLTGDARLSDARSPLPGSVNYIQNQNLAPQASTFNIAGDGSLGGTLSAADVNAVTQFNLGGGRILSMPGTDNLYVGWNAGGNSTGSYNNFFGRNAGMNTTTGSSNAVFGAIAGANISAGNDNSFFGMASGQFTTTGWGNSMFGKYAGNNNIDGYSNAFFGLQSGYANTTGFENEFIGSTSGQSNTTGSRNAFLGVFSGGANTTGGWNTFIGNNSGQTNIDGTYNSALGWGANVGTGSMTNATAVGARARVTQSNSIVLGSITGIGGAPSDTNVGIGTTAPSERLHVVGNGLFNGNLNVDGIISVNNLGAAGATQLCRNAVNAIATCSSSLRYKTNIHTFRAGLDLIDRLHPISFNWKDGGMLDLGLGAEDVAKVDPLLVTYNQKGEVEGVKYDRIGVVLINAVKEQQAQIEEQKKQNESQKKEIESQKLRLEEQQRQIDGLKKLICRANEQAEICKEQLK